MFDIGWTEMLVIAIVMIVVVGPKDLPKMLRTFGKTTSKMRAMAGDFQRQFNEALKEAELDDVKKSVDQLRSLNPTSEIKKHLNPFEKAAADVRAGLDAALKPSVSAAAASAVTHAAEPLKNGATAMSDVAGPESMPTPPVMTPMNGAAPSAEPVAVAGPQVTPEVAAAALVPAPRQTKATRAKAATPKSKPATAAKAAPGKVNGKAVAASAAKSRAAAKAKAPAAAKPAATKPVGRKTKAPAS